MSPIDADMKATQDSKAIMSTMAILHNPDQIVGGIVSDAPMDKGLTNVNSSLGSGWGSRVGSMDDAVKGVDPSVTDTTKLNVKLERCK